MDEPKKTVAVIGAGMSGLVCARWLLEEGIKPLIYESSNQIGGLWFYNPGLCTNTQRDQTSFRDFPMPPDYPDYPTNSQVHDYLVEYAKHFGIDQLITFGAAVTHLSPVQSEGHFSWDVHVTVHGHPLLVTVDGVAVCNGHHTEELMPSEAQIPGLRSFTGLSIHSHQYRTPTCFSGKQVIVSGLGISGSDIAKELAPHCATLVLSSRRVKPRDPSMLSPQETDPIMPPIQSISGAHVTFSDGTVLQHVDAIVWCWGYKYSFPFFQHPSVLILEAPSRVQLYKHMFSPQLPGLAFIGLPTVRGSLHPIAERQAIWYARLMAGKATLPTKAEMEQWMDDWARSLVLYHVNYRPMQVDAQSYLLQELGETRED